MDVTLLISAGFVLLVSLLWFPFLIRIAKIRSWIDIPTSRRRHRQPTPIVGGVGIVASWLFGIVVYGFLRPDWLSAHAASLIVLTTAVIAIVAIGLMDDLKGLSPALKLITEFAVAAYVLALEPNIHTACSNVIAAAPIFAQPILWGLAAVWIVGAANAINLIDGIDGFAGGVSLLGMITTVFLHNLSGSNSSPIPTLLLLCLPGLLIFLRHNWAPAKIFLGDNGSLTLGFLLACGGLIPTSAENAPAAVGSLLILLAYPILDMGLCVFRRFRNGYPIFKADRSHLHHRVQRLGLSVPQTTTLLLCAVGFFQASALVVHMVHSRLAVLVAGTAVLGLFTLLYLIQCMESWQREMLLDRALTEKSDFTLIGADTASFLSVIEVDLRPLLEVGLFEERSRAEYLLGTLLITIRQSIRAKDRLTVSDQKMKIYLSDGIKGWQNRTIVEKRVKGRLRDFQQLFGLQYSLDGLPLEAKEVRGRIASA